jgi:RNA polymerase sigma factor (sigma-70 family)
VGTRGAGGVITGHLDLEAVWPEASRALRGYLRARGASSQDAEDVLQECVLRVLHARPTFVDAQDLVRWCIPVVRNLQVDLYRRERREMPVESVPDRPCRGDVADDVAHHLELGRVLRALQQLRPADRDAIVSHVQQDGPDPLDRKSAVRLNVQRHRARQRLLARLAAVLAAGWASWRKAGRVAAPAALPAALAVGLLSVPLHVLIGPGLGPHRSLGGRAVLSESTLPFVQQSVAAPLPAAPRLRVPVAPSAPRAPKARPAHVVVAAAAPTGEGVQVVHQDPDQQSVVICARDVLGLPDICVSEETHGGTGGRG